MAIVGLGLMNIFLALNLRFPEDSAFGRGDAGQPQAALGVRLGRRRLNADHPARRPAGRLRHRLAHGTQWAICLVPGVALLALGELFKIVLRARRPN